MRSTCRARFIVYASLTILLMIALTSVLVEMGLRFYRGGLFSEPPRRYQGLPLEFFKSAYPAAYDPLLGYKPRPGAGGSENPWGRKVTITAEGFRSNGSAESLSGAPVLALGDSFTFGDEVNDDESWPAHLEKILGRPVLNAGVFGYGLDQMVLRAEQLLDSITPALLIVSITPDDIFRCEFSYRYAWKPYFDIVDGELALRNVPVPEPGTLTPEETLLQRALRGSHLVSFLVMRLDPDRWAIPDAIRAHERGMEVAGRLVDRLAGLGGERGIPILFVSQWVPGPDYRPARALVGRARESGLRALDLERPLLRLLPEEHDEMVRWKHLFNIEEEKGEFLMVGHMNPRGNEAVARIIAREIPLMKAK